MDLPLLKSDITIILKSQKPVRYSRNQYKSFGDKVLLCCHRKNQATDSFFFITDISDPRYVGEFPSFTPGFGTSTFYIPSKIRKAWTMSINQHFLIYRANMTTRIIQEFE